MALRAPTCKELLCSLLLLSLALLVLFQINWGTAVRFRPVSPLKEETTPPSPSSNQDGELVSLVQKWASYLPDSNSQHNEYSPYVFPSLDMMYCAVPKSSCTQFKILIARVLTGNPNLTEVHNSPLFLSSRLSKLSETEIQTVAHSEMLRWVVVRDPIERVLSGWLQVTGPVAPVREFHRFVFQNVQNEIGKSEDNLCSISTIHGVALRKYQHWQSQLCLCGFWTLPPSFWRIFRIEMTNEIKELVQMLLERFPQNRARMADFGWGQENSSFLSTVLYSENWGNHAHGTQAKMVQYYSPEIFEIVVKARQREVDFFGYQEFVDYWRKIIYSSHSSAKMPQTQMETKE